jgi:RNA polymerase sigma-70 factor (ECF subfamily)
MDAGEQRGKQVDTPPATGGGDAFRSFYDATSGTAFSLAFEIVGGDRRLAEEACEAAYGELWERSGRVGVNAASWDEAALLTQVRERALQASAEARVARERSAGPGAAYMKAAVREGLEKLNPLARRALELAYFGGLPVREIAELLGEPPEVVRRAMREALLTLGALTRDPQETVR